MKIGELARRSGVTIDTIRFYEQQGLLDSPPRTQSKYRDFPPEALERLTFIRRARELGFRLEEIGELLVLAAAQQAGARDVRELTAAKLQDVQRRIVKLNRIAQSLSELLCLCQGDRITRAHCPILQAFTAPVEGEG